MLTNDLSARLQGCSKFLNMQFKTRDSLPSARLADVGTGLKGNSP
jgi:hypothetical protein